MQIERAIDLIKKANFIYIIGNGGAASHADHLACDLLKGCGLKAISLCSNNSLITAIGNDISFDDIFILQIERLFMRNDVLIAISTSGESKNIIKAARHVINNDGMLIGITKKGSTLYTYLRHGIFLELTSNNTQDMEDEIAIICHQIYRKVIQ